MTTQRELIQALLDGKTLQKINRKDWIMFIDQDTVRCLHKDRPWSVYLPCPDKWQIKEEQTVILKEEKPMAKQYMKNEKEFMEALLEGRKLTTDHTKTKIYLLENGSLVYEKQEGEARSMTFSNIDPAIHWFIVPKTININGFEVPEPERKPLKKGMHYWVPNIYRKEDQADRNTWTSPESDGRILDLNLIHLTKEAAELHAKALLSFTQLKEA